MELGVLGMTLKMKPTIGTQPRRTVALLTAAAQAAILMFCGLAANAQEGNRLQDIQVQSLPGQRVEIKLIVSGTLEIPIGLI